MWEHVGPIATVLALLLSIITVSLGALLKFSMARMETALAEIELSLRGAINQTAKEIDAKVDQQGRLFGEVAASLREHINVEIKALRKEMTDDQKYVRDEFVRRDSFYSARDQLAADIHRLGDELKAQMNRLENRIINGGA